MNFWFMSDEPNGFLVHEPRELRKVKYMDPWIWTWEYIWTHEHEPEKILRYVWTYEYEYGKLHEPVNMNLDIHKMVHEPMVHEPTWFMN